MEEIESINKHNAHIREMQVELETLTLKGPHLGSSYDHTTGFRVGHLRAEIHVTTLQRNYEIKTHYSQLMKNS